jgi:hypothetical protein
LISHPLDGMLDSADFHSSGGGGGGGGGGGVCCGSSGGGSCVNGSVGNFVWHVNVL